MAELQGPWYFQPDGKTAVPNPASLEGKEGLACLRFVSLTEGKQEEGHIMFLEPKGAGNLVREQARVFFRSLDNTGNAAGEYEGIGGPKQAVGAAGLSYEFEGPGFLEVWLELEKVGSRQLVFRPGAGKNESLPTVKRPASPAPAAVPEVAPPSGVPEAAKEELTAPAVAASSPAPAASAPAPAKDAPASPAGIAAVSPEAPKAKSRAERLRERHAAEAVDASGG